MKKEVKFSLVFRDIWQSAGKYVPRVEFSILFFVKQDQKQDQNGFEHTKTLIK